MITKKTRMECLFNPTEEERIEREPLLKYSFYLSSKNILLLDVLDEVVLKVDIVFFQESISAEIIGD